MKPRRSLPSGGSVGHHRPTLLPDHHRILGRIFRRRVGFPAEGNSGATTEVERIRAVYAGRATAALAGRYSPFRRGELYMSQRRDEELLRLLAEHGLTNLAELRILEIGCGRGARLLDFCQWGATPARLHGVDLVEAFVREGATRLPRSGLLVATADRLPYRDGIFDLVLQFTVFTSILDRDMRAAAAAEMRRVTAPGGSIIWYDFRYPSPRNPNVDALGLGDIRQLFAGWEIAVRSLTLLPPVARRLAPFSFLACRVLERSVPPLRSHLFALLRKPRS
jgi:SAM-dependent methyltransferase